MELLAFDDLPDWFIYPEDFLKLIESGVVDIGPWQILHGQWLYVRFEGLKKRFPERSLVPFSRRLDNDDVACWDRINPLSVFIVHDFCAPGWESRGEYVSFLAWYAAAQEDAKNYDD